MEWKSFKQAKNFIFSDVQREIDLASTGSNAGNYLTALGLLNYTELMGNIKNDKFKQGFCKNNFNEFFDSMGAEYKEFRANHDVYDIFRCGLSHEYYVKGTCTIYMLNGTETCGVGKQDDGKYYFVVERYFNSFKKAVSVLENKIFYNDDDE